MNENIRQIDYPDEKELKIADPEPEIGIEMIIKNTVAFNLFLPVIEGECCEDTRWDD